MARIEILVEEQSAAVCLKELLPQIVPEGWVYGENYFIVEHQGKQDLQRSLRNKTKAYNKWFEPIAVVVLQDKDGNDCKQLKREILDIIGEVKYPHLVRIVCTELEAWFLGDMDAISMAYPKFKSEQYKERAKYRDPDHLGAKEELKRILPEYSEIRSSKEISKYLDIGNNRSQSFRQFVMGVKKIFKTIDPSAY
ncbi:MAG: DUF4276 family protein [Rikenellaceae bacterium]